MDKAHRRAQALIRERLAEWKHRPLVFVQEALNVSHIEQWQHDVLVDLETEDQISIKSGHGVGKTALLSWLIWWYLFTQYPCRIPCTAPSEHQLNDILWSELAKWRERLTPPLNQMAEMNSDMAYIKGSKMASFAAARVARKERPEAFQGFHSDHVLLILDEASGIEDIIYETALGATTGARYKIILTGNPTRTTGFFYNSFTKARKLWKTYTVSNLDITRAGHDGRYAENIASQYGKESNIYRIRVLGMFPEASANAVFPIGLVEEATVRKDVEPIMEFWPVWGLDVARTGTNRTAIAKRCSNVLLEPIKARGGLDTVQVVGWLREEYEATSEPMRPREIIVDTIGLGAGVFDVARREGLPVRGMNVAERPTVFERGKKRFTNMRAELYWKAREWFEDRTCIMPDDGALITELAVIEYDYTQPGLLIKVEGKDDIVKKLQDEFKSPDLADAFMLTFAGGRVRRREPIRGPRKRYGRSHGYRRDSDPSGWAA